MQPTRARFKPARRVVGATTGDRECAGSTPHARGKPAIRRPLCHDEGMPSPIEDYALIGDCHTGALVGRDGSIDWLCLPRFDSASTFGAVLGTPDHGDWVLRPVGAQTCTSRSYRDGTFVLETRWETPDGTVEVIDLMPMGHRRPDVIRRVRGISGTVRMRQELRIRFGYADALPWVRQIDEGEETGRRTRALVAVAGPDSVVVRGPHLEPKDHVHAGEFDVAEGETVDIVLTWFPSHREPPEAIPVDERIAETETWWRGWRAAPEDGDRDIPEYHEAVERSLLVLRALTDEDTGGIVAAATTSLPEDFGGERNWDYRYVWLRDASLTLDALMRHGGFREEVHHWRNWLLRAIAGDPGDLQIVYGIAGERRLAEWEVSTLPGYDGASPVRVGNEAYLQFQGDIFGEVMLALDLARQVGIEDDRFSWALQVAILEYLESALDRPDHGIWEMRGPERMFTQSRAMMWAAFDRGVAGVTEHGLRGPAEKWARLRDKLRDEIEEHGFDADRNSYVQYYGTTEVDASLLTLGAIGYVAPDHPRMLGTVAAIEQDLMRDGLLRRYRTEAQSDGVSGDENLFLACSFWLVQQYAASGRLDDAAALMDRLLSLRNDVGLLSEQYDVTTGCQAGNTPQALSHLALLRAADAIATARRGQPQPRGL
jgi:GH15 family glucan-1,4-alpha-glucosidase